MLQSKLFTKTRREAPKDEISKNASHLVRAGFIYKEMAGAYVFLPLGLRVLNKIIDIIREEMDAVGGEEISMTALQEKETWESTTRWDDEVLDVWFKTKLKNDTELGLATTHEEPLTKMMKEFIRSYRDLPALPYQFQTKFRNELRTKSGLMRTREFLMKDLYSFAKDKQDHEKIYESLKQAYINIFNRLGIGDITYLTFASGGSFSPYSHEFQTLTKAGEDTVFVDHKKKIAVNKDVLEDKVLSDLKLKREELIEEKAIEVGNIFSLGTRFSEALSLYYSDDSGKDQLVVMGSYGIGPARVMGAILEALAEGNSMVWPHVISPFRIHLIDISGGKEEIKEVARSLYDELNSKGIDVLYDDRDVQAGEKFTDADLIGIPLRVVISEKSLSAGGAEWLDRINSEEKICSIKAVCENIEKIKI